MGFEDQYLDVLQNLEWAIVNEFRQDKSILDMDARDAVTSLARRYEAEMESRGASRTPLSERAERIAKSMQAMCEWRLGRAPGPGQDMDDDATPLNLEEIVRCLKRIAKSINMWNKEGGNRGYLGFVSRYVL